jgi:GNAT superfamily N-acetyltransferase
LDQDANIESDMGKAGTTMKSNVSPEVSGSVQSDRVEVREVKSSADLKQFIMLPFRLYRDDPNWVAPLIGDQKKFLSPAHNPFFEHSKAALFLALREGRTVGRISAQTNTRHNLEHGYKVGFFGFFECEDDHEAADALYERAIAWNKAKDRDSIRGPFNFTINDECGLLVDGFGTPPMIMMTHSRPYYQRLIERSGFTKAMDMYAYFAENHEVPPRLARIYEVLLKRSGVQIRSLSRDKRQQARDMEDIFFIYNEAWQYNWGAVPFTRREFDHLKDQLLPLADPELVLIASMAGRPVGFSLALPNYTEVLKVMRGRVNLWTLAQALIAKRKISSSRAITMGVIKEYQNRGIDTLFHYLLFKSGIRKGITRAEFSWVLESNTMMNRLAEMLGARIYKTYRIYEKQI